MPNQVEPQPATQLTAMLETVRIALVQRDDLEFLCNEMLATLNLPRNAGSISNEMRDVAATWTDRYREITKKEAHQ